MSADTTVTAGGEDVLVSVENGVAWIRLNRPEVMNAVSAPMRRALVAALRQAERDPATRAVVLTGQGRAFCAGADIGEFTGADLPLEQMMEDYLQIVTGLHSMPKPTIAAVNGAAAGIGASFAMACDIRYGSPSASFVEAFVRIGLTPDGGASWLLPRLVGTGRALEAMYTGAPVRAEQAERWGLLNRVVEGEALLERVTELAESLARGPARSLAAIKRSVKHAAGADLDEAFEFEALLQGTLFATADHAEGVSAFLAKRTPEFRGE